MLLSTFQTCPHPSPLPVRKRFFDFPFVIIPCVSSSVRNPSGQGLLGKQNSGIPEAPLQTNPRRPLTRVAGRVPSTLPRQSGWSLCPSALIHSCPRPLPFFPPRAYFSAINSHPASSLLLLHVSITSRHGSLQSTSAHSYWAPVTTCQRTQSFSCPLSPKWPSLLGSRGRCSALSQCIWTTCSAPFQSFVRNGHGVLKLSYQCPLDDLLPHRTGALLACSVG